MPRATDEYCVTPNCTNLRASRRRYCNKCRSRKWRSANELKAVFLTLRANAKRRGVQFLLTIEEFKEWCIKEKYLERRGLGAEDATIDRRIDDGPYAVYNMQVLSNADNVRKASTSRIKRMAARVNCPREPGDPF